MFSLLWHRSTGGADDSARPDWERDLPVGRPVFDPSLRTAAELVAEAPGELPTGPTDPRAA